MGNLGASQNGQPGATNAGQGQGATGTAPPLGNSALGFVVDNTGLGTAQAALRQSGIRPAAFHAAGAAAAAGAHAMAPTAPPWPHPGLGLAPELLLNAVMRMIPGGAGAVAGGRAASSHAWWRGHAPACHDKRGGGGGGSDAARLSHFRTTFPGDEQQPSSARGPVGINNQQMGEAGTAALTLLGQVAHMSPPAGPAGRGGGATAAAGLGGATGGLTTFGQTGMYSNVGGDANQATAGAGDGLRLPGVGPGAAAAAAAGFPSAPACPSHPNRPSPWRAGASDGWEEPRTAQ